MMITKLTISDNYRKVFSTSFDKKTLIWSADNSYGKTTLVRFILYALGFDVPSTKKINMKKYHTTIELDDPKIFINRAVTNFDVLFVEENVKKTFDLSKELEIAHGFIFGLSNTKVINNLLGTFYIDQDKGWTLLNRGKVTASNIRFNIEDFIFGVSDCDTSKFDVEISKKENEIKRYEAILDVVALSEEQQTGYKETEMVTKLKCEKSNIQFCLREIDNQMEDLRKTKLNNQSLIDTIESYKLQVRIPDKSDSILVTKDNIVDFELNQFILDSHLRELKLRKEEIELKLLNINSELSEYDRLINVDEVSTIVINQLKSINFNQTQLFDLIEKLKKEKKKIEDNRNYLITYQTKVITMLSEKIKEYASELNVFDGYIDKETDYLKTRTLKEHSGALYHKTTLCYRLAYYHCIRKILGVELPFIIDSPGSAEVKADGMAAMINLIKNVVGDGQIIVSSIYDEELNFGASKKITLTNGIFGDNI